jgi:hypothetical protein
MYLNHLKYVWFALTVTNREWVMFLSFLCQTESVGTGTGTGTCATSTIGGIIAGGFNVFGNVVFLSFTRSKGAYIAARVYR